MADADQLMLIQSDAREEVPAPQSALLVTNHLNLMYMLAAGPVSYTHLTLPTKRIV